MRTQPASAPPVARGPWAALAIAEGAVRPLQKHLGPDLGGWDAP